jgi:1-acyl-sn-glycerol-3-phosphate acyltransferase
MPDLQLQQGPAARARWQIKAFRLGIRVIFLFLFRVRITGLDRVPSRNAIICFNHLGWTEGFLVLLFFPTEPRIYGLGERQVAYLSSWRTRLLNWLEVFVPLDRDSPRQALRVMEDVVVRGGSLALAPEGHLGLQEGTIAPLQPGAAFISRRTGAPLIPVGITGSLDLWFRRTLTMRVGEPIYPEQFGGEMRERTHAMTARLEADIRALLPGDTEQARYKLFRERLTKLL